MFGKGADVIAEYEQITDYDAMGVINLKEMGNLPFYIVEHKRAQVPLSEWDTVFANAEFEFIDVAKKQNVPDKKTARVR